jgi:hypothetical protein
MNNMAIYFLLSIFLLFAFYGFSNLYIIVYLRKKANHVMGLVEFILLFAGDIKNYYRLNKAFKKTYLTEGVNIFFNSLVAIIHLASPLIIIVIFLFLFISKFLI